MQRVIDADAVAALEATAFKIRKLSLETILNAQWGHIGGSFSLAEILATLYFDVLHIDPKHPNAENRDRLILSKAHASPALYAALVLRGFMAQESLYSYCRVGGLDGHTSVDTPGVDYSGGSLGTGLGYSVGLAMGLARRELFDYRVVCILGDGESNEGQVWESAMSASHYRLDNLIVVIDYNKVSAKGFVRDLMGVEPLNEKWEAFGWRVIEVDGHDVAALHGAFYRARYIEIVGKPICIIAHTVKGKMLSEAQFNYNWHTHAPDSKKAKAFLAELCATSGREAEEFDQLPERGGDGGLRAVIESDLEGDL